MSAPSKAQGMVALLRGVNVGGHRRVPMADLVAVARSAGFEDVATYIQSGNVVFVSPLPPERAEAVLERAIEKEFGFPVDVVVRAAARWRSYAAGSPFPESEKENPKLIQLALAKAPLARNAAGILRERAAAGERVEVRGDALWIAYPEGIARSKLSPALVDRAAGSPVTARNWRTVAALAGMLADLGR